MEELKYTLITDGSSDIALMNIIKWLLDDLYPKLSNNGKYADFSNLRTPPKKNEVLKRINHAKEYYPFDILIYHRDAEATNIDIIEQRILEIKDHVPENSDDSIVCVIPMKMMETWLLISSDALKKAAGNRNYKENINLPNINRLESNQDPKTLLHTKLKECSGLKTRRLDKFNTHQAVHLVAEYIEDYSPLRELYSFSKFENDLKLEVDKILEH